MILKSHFNRATKAETQVEVADEPTSTIEPATTETKKRPRLDISQLTGGRDRKRGKTMFGILLGTLNKAKIEDKERSASEAVSTDMIYFPSRPLTIHRQKNDN